MAGAEAARPPSVLVLFYVFGDRVFDGGTKSIDVDVNLPKVEQPAK